MFAPLPDHLLALLPSLPFPPAKAQADCNLPPAGAAASSVRASFAFGSAGSAAPSSSLQVPVADPAQPPGCSSKAPPPAPPAREGERRRRRRRPKRPLSPGGPGFDGIWRDDLSGVTYDIDGRKVIHVRSSGFRDQWTFETDGDKCVFHETEGDKLEGRLSSRKNKITWDDGDIWFRVKQE